jgi:hypothetical protein
MGLIIDKDKELIQFNIKKDLLIAVVTIYQDFHLLL